MQDNSYLQDFGDDDICSLYGDKMVKFGKVRSALDSLFGEIDGELGKQLEERLGIQSPIQFHGWKRRSNLPLRGWFSQGVDCEILNMGAKGWQKGKLRVKITLEFCPDEPAVEEPPASKKPESTEPESPLDDIRRMIKEENQ